MENKNLVEESRGSSNEGVVYEEESEKSITLSQIWHMIKKRWVAVILCGLIGFGAGFGYSKLLKTPKYQSSVQLMVTTPSDETSTTATNINLAIQKTAIAYNYFKTDTVAEKVAEKMAKANYDVALKDDNDKTIEGQYDITKVKGYYTITIPTVVSNSTSIFLTVTSTCKSKQMAIDVANFVAESGRDLANTKGQIGYAELANSLQIINKAYQAKDTSTSTAVISLIGLAAGIVIGLAYAIIRNLADTKVTSKAELESIAGYKVIGMIPLCEDEEGENENAK